MTVAIVTLVSRDRRPLEIALHRFVEVAVGIMVGLAVSALWPIGDLPNDNPPRHA